MIRVSVIGGHRETRTLFKHFIRISYVNHASVYINRTSGRASAAIKETSSYIIKSAPVWLIWPVLIKKKPAWLRTGTNKRLDQLIYPAAFWVWIRKIFLDHCVTDHQCSVSLWKAPKRYSRLREARRHQDHTQNAKQQDGRPEKNRELRHPGNKQKRNF